jgi:hypothetical protein
MLKIAALYHEGHLIPEKEKAIAIDLANFLRQQEQEQKKQRGRGFER